MIVIIIQKNLLFMVSYIGGKSKIAKSLIIPKIPRNIEIYVEPFGGMFWTFFGFKIDEFKNLKKVVYNDFNPLNVNVFNCLKNFQEFSRVINTYPSQKKDLFIKFQQELFHSDIQIDLNKPDYDLASKYLYLLTQVFSGTNPEKASFIDLKGKYKSKFDSFKNKLVDSKWQEHFLKITNVENMDFEDIIQKYDSPKTFFYCDPPYFGTEKYYANHEFNIESHERLANCLKKIKGQFSLSYYKFEKLQEWFSQDQYVWKTAEFSKSAMAKSGKSQTKAQELLIMNY